MKIALLVTYCILIYIHESLEGKLNFLKSVDSCPINEHAWKQKSIGFICSEEMTYHCIFAVNESMYELCMNAKDIKNEVGCPQINFYEDEILFDSSYSECPSENKDCPKGNETYKTDSLYKFPACLQRVSIRADFRTSIKMTFTESTTGGPNNTNDTGAIVGSVAATCIIVIAIIVTIIQLWRKGKLGICLRLFPATTSRRPGRRPSRDAAEGGESSLEPGIEVPLVDGRNIESHANSASNTVNDVGGTTVEKFGGIFDKIFKVKDLGNDVTLKKDGTEVKAGKRIVMSQTEEGLRLIIFRLEKGDEGKYICSSTKTMTVDTVQLRIEKPTRAIYHDECILSLSSIPHILFSIQQAMRHASQAKETTELMSSLDTIKRETFRVLTLSYENIKKVQMLCLKIEAVHIKIISKALRRTLDVGGIVSKMAKDIGEGGKMIQETLDEVQKVKDLIESVESNFAQAVPTLSEDMFSCHKHLKNLFTKWTLYGSIFSSMRFVILEGRSLTSDLDADAFSQYDLGVLQVYVRSVRCSTSYYAVIYMSEIRKLLDDFFVDEFIEMEKIDSLAKRIQEQYDEMYDRDSRGSDNIAISYTESETTPSISDKMFRLIEMEKIDTFPQNIQKQSDEKYDRDSRVSDNRAISYTESDTTPSIKVLDESSQN